MVETNAGAFDVNEKCQVKARLGALGGQLGS